MGVKTTVTKKPKTPKSILKKMTGKKNALAQKKAGKGIFVPKTLSSELAAICGAKVMSRPEVTKKIWTYIKAKKLNSGRLITPDATLGKVLGKKLDMLQIAKALSAHLK